MYGFSPARSDAATTIARAHKINEENLEDNSINAIIAADNGWAQCSTFKLKKIRYATLNWVPLMKYKLNMTGAYLYI